MLALRHSLLTFATGIWHMKSHPQKSHSKPRIHCIRSCIQWNNTTQIEQDTASPKAGATLAAMGLLNQHPPRLFPSTVLGYQQKGNPIIQSRPNIRHQPTFHLHYCIDSACACAYTCSSVEFVSGICVRGNKIIYLLDWCFNSAIPKNISHQPH